MQGASLSLGQISQCKRHAYYYKAFLPLRQPIIYTYFIAQKPNTLTYSILPEHLLNLFFKFLRAKSRYHVIRGFGILLPEHLSIFLGAKTRYHVIRDFRILLPEHLSIVLSAKTRYHVIRGFGILSLKYVSILLSAKTR